MVSFLAQCHPSGVLVIIVFDMVEFLLDDIEKTHLSVFCPVYFRLIFDMPLAVIIPPIFDMGEELNDCNGGIFSIGKIENIDLIL